MFYFILVAYVILHQPSRVIKLIPFLLLHTYLSVPYCVSQFQDTSHSSLRSTYLRHFSHLSIIQGIFQTLLLILFTNHQPYQRNLIYLILFFQFVYVIHQSYIREFLLDHLAFQIIHHSLIFQLLFLQQLDQYLLLPPQICQQQRQPTSLLDSKSQRFIFQ